MKMMQISPIETLDESALGHRHRNTPSSSSDRKVCVASPEDFGRITEEVDGFDQGNRTD